MKSFIELIIASAIVIAVSALATVILKSLGFTEQVASGISSVFLASIPSVHQAIQSRNPRLTLNVLPVDIVQPRLFYLPWHNMIIYGGMLLAAAMSLGSFLGGVVAAFSDASFSKEIDAPLSKGVQIILFVSIIGGLVAAFPIGSWIGRRCDRYGVIIVLASVCLARLLTLFIDYTYTSTVNLAPELVNQVGNELDPKVILSRIAISIIVYFPVMLFGYWRGKRRRQAAYISFLLSRLPAEAQNVLADLAYEESCRIQGVQMRGERASHANP